jgi:hypothetical protein
VAISLQVSRAHIFTDAAILIKVIQIAMNQEIGNFPVLWLDYLK